MLSTKTLLALLPFFMQHVNAGASGTGTTTRCKSHLHSPNPTRQSQIPNSPPPTSIIQHKLTYLDWDCCKPSCAWTGKADLVGNPVTTCSIDDVPLTDYAAVNGCSDGGTAYMCSTQQPWAITDDLAYGFAAVNIADGSESTWCCACYELTFTSGTAEGKKMVVQATNTGSDLGSNQFDIAVRSSLPPPFSLLPSPYPSTQSPFQPHTSTQLTPPLRCPAAA